MAKDNTNAGPKTSMLVHGVTGIVAQPIQVAANKRGHGRQTAGSGAGGLLGAMLGSFGGPVGALVGAGLGALAGYALCDD